MDNSKETLLQAASALALAASRITDAALNYGASRHNDATNAADSAAFALHILLTLGYVSGERQSELRRVLK